MRMLFMPIVVASLFSVYPVIDWPTGNLNLARASANIAADNASVGPAHVISESTNARFGSAGRLLRPLKDIPILHNSGKYNCGASVSYVGGVQYGHLSRHRIHAGGIRSAAIYLTRPRCGNIPGACQEAGNGGLNEKLLLNSSLGSLSLGTTLYRRYPGGIAVSLGRRMSPWLRSRSKPRQVRTLRVAAGKRNCVPSGTNTRQRSLALHSSALSPVGSL
jgi:hypothetical protein